MKIESTTKQSYPTLVLRGDFETDHVPAFLAAVDQARAKGGKGLMVSFRYVKYINSTALGSVVRVAAACKDAGGDLVILQPSRLSNEIIRKMGLDGVLRCFDTEEEAAGFLRGEGVAPVAADVPTAAGEEVSVMFSFDDGRADLIPGKGRRHGVAVLDSVDADHLVFHWDPARHGADEGLATALFPVGGKVRNKLQLKMMRKGFLEAEATIESATFDAAGSVIVKARWSSIAEADREAITRYRQDLDYLRQQAVSTDPGAGRAEAGHASA